MKKKLIKLQGMSKNLLSEKKELSGAEAETVKSDFFFCLFLKVASPPPPVRDLIQNIKSVTGKLMSWKIGRWRCNRTRALFGKSMPPSESGDNLRRPMAYLQNWEDNTGQIAVKILSFLYTPSAFKS